MASFRDNAGRTWTIVVNFATACRIEDEAGVDIRKIFDQRSEDHARIQRPSSMFRTICAAIRDEMNARGVTEDDIGRAMDGDAIAAAEVAVHEAAIDFFPKSMREKILTAYRNQIRIGMQVAEMSLDQALSGVDSAADSPES